mmetsp:Transcript_16242/g.44979  ORF Transcript_16242/g.44979 Transcript_16242/m.44979 type:complete len:640 (-) Transcript_16242:87-2006(-)|eukprot:CAMPEP_0172373138 /NCGR_PEP_ID=MMETSP1060-20121228/50375_1 /TAXON_ID=37318 /ORGANISM="Pseudo-nitzschia pungens, Strain cf. cingulata" /LENGTH=639 /DNA_ID=CAMNT_0013099369 /DNA_START=32 /DNA_END=1951 /DNA_ORIENTATION=-
MGKSINDHADVGADQEQDELYGKYGKAFFCNKLAAGHACFTQMKRFSQQSRLDRFDDEVHSVPWSAIQKKSLLGQGAYSFVYKVQVSMHDDESKSTSLKSKKYYALKHIKPDITEESKDFEIAAIDLAVEGEILSRLRHENIIKLHGIFADDPRTAYVNFKHGYFLLIDILQDTLTRRLAKMRRSVKKKKRGGIPTILDMIQNVATGIANGLEYLHENGVILRDLKSDNVGFDANDNPVIFDLGFARELHTVHKSEVAGSLRYMAPEMGLSQGATLASDVYSFGVLLYELCTFEKPFKTYKGRPEFIQDVFINNYRPDLTNISSKAIKDLISNCWDTDQSKRPSMRRVGNILRVETALLCRQQLPRRNEKFSMLQKSDHSLVSFNSTILSGALGSIGSFCPLKRSSANRNSSSSLIPTCSASDEPDDTKNSFARRSSIISRMSAESFNWNSSSSPGDQEDPCDMQNTTFRKTLRRRNSMTSSLFDRRRRRNSVSLTPATEMKESGSSGSLTLNDIKESSPSDPTKEKQSNQHLKRRSSNDSMSSFVSQSGDSYNNSWSADMSTSNFTLGEFRARAMGGSRRNSFFSSFSKDLFTIDVRRGSNLAADTKIEDAVFAVDSFEDLPSVAEKEGVHSKEPERV